MENNNNIENINLIERISSDNSFDSLNEEQKDDNVSEEYNEDIIYLNLFDNLLKNKDLVYDIQKYVNNYSFNSFLKELDN